ncbi:MAG: pantoate--beta-alanine ligase, partial [Acidimicrobiales bacterium]
GVEIAGVPTVREPDGLALSSRNRRLTTQQRKAATVIPRAIEEARRIARRPAASIGDVLAAAEAVVTSVPTASLDYVSVFDADTLVVVHDVPESNRLPDRYRVAIAVHFGDIRLIDNADLFAL